MNLASLEIKSVRT